MTTSYATVTELPGSRVTAEQLSMLYTRYHLAASVGEGKDVLEVACGPGLGLGYLASRARSVVAGDYDGSLLQYARASSSNGVRLLRLDAHVLPFASGSFDVVFLFEALYYLAHPEKFVEEARRVLRAQGMVVISTANKDWPGFNPSPFAFQYLSASELDGLLRRYAFVTELLGGFPEHISGRRDRVLSAVRRLAIGLHLVPPTMKGKEWLKRLAYGRLMVLPREVQEGMATMSEFVPLAVGAPASTFKVLYALGRMP